MRDWRDPHPRRVSPTTLALAVCLAAVVCPVEDVSAEAEAEPEPRESEICLDCHDGYDLQLRGTPHHLKPDALDSSTARIACADCHPGDVNHYEEDPEEYPRISPDTLPPLEAADLCASCHTNSHQQNMSEGNVHSRNEVNCSGCHSVHGNRNPALLKADQTTLCLDCHTDVTGDFAQPYRHPVSDAIVACSDCHTTLDVNQRELSWNGTNSSCTSCHAEFQGPFPFEHQAAVDYSTEEGGCQACHDPHGSYLPRLLKQPYEPPHYQLCSQCHAVPRHNNNTFHGTTWAGVACNECHTDTHGSFTSRLFLSEELKPQGCFNVGCHQF